MARDENELLAQIPGPQLEITPIDPEASASQEVERLRMALEDGNANRRREETVRLFGDQQPIPLLYHECAPGRNICPAHCRRRN